MSEARDDCRFRDDAGPWVLGALGEPDAAAFAAHLELCPACRREVAELQAVADVLPMAAPQMVPPAELKGRIMAVVDAEAELLRAAGPEVERVAAPRRAQRGREPAWLGRLRPLPVAAALATAALAVGVALGVVLSGGDGTTTHPGFGPAGAQVALHVSDDDRGELDFRNMSAPPSGRVYQVWLVTGNDKPRPTHALFTVMADGRARVEIPESVEGADQVLVSDEPPGGSAQPTGKVVAGAKLS